MGRFRQAFIAKPYFRRHLSRDRIAYTEILESAIVFQVEFLVRQEAARI